MRKHRERVAKTKFLTKIINKEKFRKALEGAGNDEDSDDEDFLGGPSATNAPMAKVSKRVIFDDDDDDD